MSLSVSLLSPPVLLLLTSAGSATAAAEADLRVVFLWAGGALLGAALLGWPVAADVGGLPLLAGGGTPRPLVPARQQAERGTLHITHSDGVLTEAQANNFLSLAMARCRRNLQHTQRHADLDTARHPHAYLQHPLRLQYHSSRLQCSPQLQHAVSYAAVPDTRAQATFRRPFCNSSMGLTLG